MRGYETNAYVRQRPQKGRRGKPAIAPSFRIAAGEFKGRELATPLIASTHPMGSRERLALFNSVSEHLDKAVVLDAFAGTGSLGFEALSRGAAHVSFIEKNQKAASAITANIKALNVADRTHLYTARVEALAFSKKFDIVIADPPYDFFLTFSGNPSKVSLETLNTLASYAKKAFILSHPAEFDPHSIDANLLSTRAYAAARISIFAPKSS